VKVPAQARNTHAPKLTASLLGIVCSLAFFPDSAAQGITPSIDCARAASAVEELVCRDSALASLDRKLVEVYATASKTASSDQRNRLAADQQRWLNERDACVKSDNKSACAKERYLHRIADLQAQFKLAPSRGPFRLVCNNDPGSVLVAQYFDTDPATARFTHDGRTVTAFVQRSGSGARYGGTSVSYWEHQGEASVVWFGRAMKCATRP
jgi:uncharacterized protein